MPVARRPPRADSHTIAGDREIERAARSNAVNMRAVVAYTTPLVLVAFGLLLFIAWRRGRLARTFVAATVVLAVAWGLALAAIWADYRDVVEARPSTPLLSDG